jgi:hypothetical protein
MKVTQVKSRNGADRRQIDTLRRKRAAWCIACDTW